MSYAYELVDHTDDETYFGCGLWLSLEEAIAELNSCKEPEDCDSPAEHDDSDIVIFQIQSAQDRLGRVCPTSLQENVSANIRWGRR